MVKLELQTDQEQQQDQPDFAERGNPPAQEGVEDLGRDSGRARVKDRLEDVRRQPPQDRRSEDEAGGDFADHAGLSETPEHYGENASDQDNDRQLPQQRQQLLLDGQLTKRLPPIGKLSRRRE